ncbi:hypothetical protein FKP32DRAFT_1052731 [Trametes sanguinea]|nr:hypothetical protein FKP32DRAFT_1052731 [Trametes sanguinea]
MSIEVDANLYLFYQTPSAHGYPPPFLHHPLNDWESLWWVAMYMITDRIVDGDSEDIKSADIEAQTMVALQLFSANRGHFRERFLRGLASLRLDCIQVQAVLSQSLQLRIPLVDAYKMVEQDITKRPDPQESLNAITPTFPRVIEQIHAILSQSAPDLQIKPIPVLTGTKEKKPKEGPVRAELPAGPHEINNSGDVAF